MPPKQQRPRPAVIPNKENAREGVFYVIWAVIEKLKANKHELQAHHCEVTLIRRLNVRNYQHHTIRAIHNGSWEVKIILILFFARWYRTLVTSANGACTLKVVGELVKAFMDESLRKYGMNLRTDEYRKPLKSHNPLKCRDDKNERKYKHIKH